MNAPLHRFRAWARRLVLPLSLVLVASLVVSGLHHHRDDGARHACAVCATGHAPALETTAGSASPRLLPVGDRIIAAPPGAPRDAEYSLHSSRAPPSA